MRARLKPPGDAVRCDVCGCAFVPEPKTQREGEIEYSFFNCDYCGKVILSIILDTILKKLKAEPE